MQQLDLIPLTAEAKHDAAMLIAKLELELEELVREHTEDKKRMKEDERAMQAHIARLAHAIRDGRRPGLEDL